MNIPWGSDIANCFITNVGLVTTNGPHGHNIMACEWTHQLSYDPALVAVCINPRHATCANIRVSGEFGISLASTGQSVLSSLAGDATGKKFEKMKVAEELGYNFYSAKKINVRMVKNVSAGLECKLMKEIELGDHIMFVGEVVEASWSASEKPLAYHSGKYWGMSHALEKPSADLKSKIKELMAANKKQSL